LPERQVRWTCKSKESLGAVAGLRTSRVYSNLDTHMKTPNY